MSFARWVRSVHSRIPNLTAVRRALLAGAAGASLLAACGGGSDADEALRRLDGGAAREHATGIVADPMAAGAVGSFSIDHRIASMESAGAPISLAFLNDHVAGSKGQLRNVGGKLYAGSERIRLYGIVFYGGATIPAKADAVKIAARLRKEGFNAVRMFAWDTPLATPDTWTVTHRAQGMLNTDQTLNATALDQFDYFVHQLQLQGIYVSIPLHTSHKYTESPDCFDSCEGLHRFMPNLVDAFKRLSQSLLEHVNPYTGRAYKNDPGVFAIELSNEDSVIHRWANGSIDQYVMDPVFYPKYGVVIESMWRTWLQTRYATTADVAAAWGEAVGTWNTIAVPSWTARSTMPARKFRDWVEFVSGIDAKYMSDIHDWLKGTLGVTSLVLGGQAHYLMMHSRAGTDLADYHSYFGDKGTATGELNPITGDPVIRVQNRSVLSYAEPKDFGLYGVSEYKDPTKPGVLTEYASRMGNQYMAESEPLVSAYAGFQDLDAIFMIDSHQMNLYTSSHYYTGWYNVAVSAVARVAAALSFRRGDVTPGAPYVLKKTKDSILDTATSTRNWNPTNFHFGGNIRSLITHNMYQQVVETTAEEQVITAGGAVGGVYTTTGGQLVWKPLDRITLDTPMTKTAIGYFSETDLDLGSGIQVHVGTTMNSYAVVQLTSLKAGAPLPSSSMLLSLSGHFTVPGEYPRAPGQATYSWGNDLPRIEAVPATVSITTPKNLVVWALDPTGARKASVPVVRSGDVLQFVAGPAFDTGWYLIEESGVAANQSPTVAAAAPATATVGTAVSLSAIAADRDGNVAKVEFLVDGAVVGTSTTSPYTTNWTPASAGVRSLTARAIDDAGATTTSAPVSVTVATAGNTPPTVSLSGPASGTVDVALTLTAATADADGSVTTVEFFDGVTPIGSATSSPFTLSWTPKSAGSHFLTARATDNGSAQTTSAPLTVNVAPPPNQLPLVTLAAPATATVGSAYALTATASDSDGSVTKVDFYDGDTLVATATRSPYGATWTPQSAGLHALTARATDNAGAVGNSVAVTVDVAPAVYATSGLMAHYFASRDLGGLPAIMRVEAVNFTWSSSATPGFGVPVDNWSVRWKGSLTYPTSGTYTLQFIADDGLRVWVDGALVISKWSDGGNATYTLPSVAVTAGTRVPIVIEHYDGGGASTVAMRWRTPESGIYYPAVPASALTPELPNAAPTVSLSAPASAVAGSAVTLSASAADGDGTIAKVEFFDGATLIATDTSAPYSVSWTPLTAGTHTLIARATDNAGAAVDSAAVSVDVTAPTGGLLGQYFANTTLSGTPVLTQVEPVSFTWTSTVLPAPGLVDYWSVRWNGRVLWPTSGTYTLQVIADDGIRVWIDGLLVIDRWADSGNTTYTLAPQSVTAGASSTIRIDHFEGRGDSTVKLRWKTPSSGIYYGSVPGSALSPY